MKTSRKSRRSRSRAPRRTKTSARHPSSSGGAAPAPASPQAPAGPALPPAAEPEHKRGYVYRNPAALMRAIFRKNDPVELATTLLNESNDSTKAKIFLECLEYLYGKPVQPIVARDSGEEKVVYQYVSSIPRPCYPARTPGATDSSGRPISGAAPTARAEDSETTEEDQHE